MISDDFQSQYDSMIADLKSQPAILAAILSGSRARACSHKFSDTDMYVVIADGHGEKGAAALRRQLEHEYSEKVAIDLHRHGVQCLSQFATYGQLGTKTGWDRYALVHAVLEFDHSDGRVADLLQSKQVLTDDEICQQVERHFPIYLNTAYRSTTSLRRGNKFGARLDACQSIQHLISSLFALHGRVTPYNKFLEWELEHWPLPAIDSRELLNRLGRIAIKPTIADQRYFFHFISHLAREQGFGKFIDRWRGKLESI